LLDPVVVADHREALDGIPALDTRRVDTGDTLGMRAGAGFMGKDGQQRPGVGRSWPGVSFFGMLTSSLAEDPRRPPILLGIVYAVLRPVG
jgi:hypothetical protein